MLNAINRDSTNLNAQFYDQTTVVFILRQNNAKMKYKSKNPTHKSQ